MRGSTPLALAFLAVFAGCAFEAAAAPKIGWRVEHPFRYFRFGSELLLHKTAWDQLTDNQKQFAPVSNMERKLNNLEWWTEDIAKRIRAAREREIQDGRRNSAARLSADEIRRSVKRNGFASLMVNPGWMYSDATCFDPKTQLHRDCVGAATDNRPATHDYVNPAYHDVVVRVVPETGDSASGNCVLRADAPVFTISGKAAGEIAVPGCRGEIAARIPGQKSVRMAVAAESGEALGEPVEVSVRDFLIVGLGDSYASGEGNPEMPARLDRTGGFAPAYRVMKPGNEYETDRARMVPRRDRKDKNYAGASWTDRRCHRSIYSHQARTALALALQGDGHHAVTFLHLACSGAEILEGLLLPQAGREEFKERFRYRDEAQIGRLVRELCAGATEPQRKAFWPTGFSLATGDDYYKLGDMKIRAETYRQYDCKPSREIDLLLLSIGGNDIGFAKLIAYSTLKIELYRKKAGVSPEEAKTRLGWLEKRFDLLKRALREKLALKDLAKVLLVPYPDIVRDESGKVCPTGAKSMSISSLLEVWPDDNGKSNIEAIAGLVDGKNGLIETIKKAARGFSIVEGHRGVFGRHGFCASRPGEPETIAEIHELPSRSVSQGGTDPANQTWNVYLPRKAAEPTRKAYNPAEKFRPYAWRQRYVRTFNDDFLTMQYSWGPYNKDNHTGKAIERGMERKSRLELAKKAIGGPFHPTAHGQAIMADFTYCKAREILFGESCDEARVREHLAE
jgi:hypothetical protein